MKPPDCATIPYTVAKPSPVPRDNGWEMGRSDALTP
jgi:hypothetical protein